MRNLVTTTITNVRTINNAHSGHQQGQSEPALRLQNSIYQAFIFDLRNPLLSLVKPALFFYGNRAEGYCVS
jgi:hypothetical protein